MFFYAKYSVNSLRASVLRVGRGETPPSRTHPPSGPDLSSNPSYATEYHRVSGGFIQKLEAATETGGCSALAHFMWTAIVFTKNSLYRLRAHRAHIHVVLSCKTALQQQFYSEYLSV